MTGPVTVARGEPTRDELAALVLALALVAERGRSTKGPRPRRRGAARSLSEGPTPPGSWRSGIMSAAL